MSLSFPDGAVIWFAQRARQLWSQGRVAVKSGFWGRGCDAVRAQARHAETIDTKVLQS
jgi:hypothetical protein